MSKAHQPTPWILKDGNDFRCEILSASRPFGSGTARFVVAECNKEDAMRIVACVNAMQGISDPEIWMKSNQEHVEGLLRGGANNAAIAIAAGEEIAALKKRIAEYDKLVEELHRYAILNNPDYENTELYKQADAKMGEYEAECGQQ